MGCRQSEHISKPPSGKIQEAVHGLFQVSASHLTAPPLFPKRLDDAFEHHFGLEPCVLATIARQDLYPSVDPAFAQVDAKCRIAIRRARICCALAREQVVVVLLLLCVLRQNHGKYVWQDTKAAAAAAKAAACKRRSADAHTQLAKRVGARGVQAGDPGFEAVVKIAVLKLDQPRVGAVVHVQSLGAHQTADACQGVLPPIAKQRQAVNERLLIRQVWDVLVNQSPDFWRKREKRWTARVGRGGGCGACFILVAGAEVGVVPSVGVSWIPGVEMSEGVGRG